MQALLRFATLLLRCVLAFFRDRSEQATVALPSTRGWTALWLLSRGAFVASHGVYLSARRSQKCRCDEGPTIRIAGVGRNDRPSPGFYRKPFIGFVEISRDISLKVAAFIWVKDALDNWFTDPYFIGHRALSSIYTLWNIVRGNANNGSLSPWMEQPAKALFDQGD